MKNLLEKQIYDLTIEDFSHAEVCQRPDVLPLLTGTKVVVFFDEYGRGQMSMGDFREAVRQGAFPDVVWEIVNAPRIAQEKADKSAALKAKKIAACVGIHSGYTVAHANGEFTIDGPYCKPLIEALKKSKKARWVGGVWVLTEDKHATLAKALKNLPEWLGQQQVENEHIRAITAPVCGTYTGYVVTAGMQAFKIIGKWDSEIHNKICKIGGHLSYKERAWFIPIQQSEWLRLLLAEIPKIFAERARIQAVEDARTEEERVQIAEQQRVDAEKKERQREQKRQEKIAEDARVGRKYTHHNCVDSYFTPREYVKIDDRVYKLEDYGVSNDYDDEYNAWASYLPAKPAAEVNAKFIAEVDAMLAQELQETVTVGVHYSAGSTYSVKELPQSLTDVLYLVGNFISSHIDNTDDGWDGRYTTVLAVGVPLRTMLEKLRERLHVDYVV